MTYLFLNYSGLLKKITEYPISNRCLSHIRLLNCSKGFSSYGRIIRNYLKWRTEFPLLSETSSLDRCTCLVHKILTVIPPVDTTNPGTVGKPIISWNPTTVETHHFRQGPRYSILRVQTRIESRGG